MKGTSTDIECVYTVVDGKFNSIDSYLIYCVGSKTIMVLVEKRNVII